MFFFNLNRKPLPNPEFYHNNINELDLLRYKMRQKDLVNMIYKLEQLKFYAKTSQEILNTLEDINQNLENLQLEVIEKRKETIFIFFILCCCCCLATK